jgi:hypothetical protein
VGGEDLGAGQVTDGRLTLNLSGSVDSQYLAEPSEDFPGISIDTDAICDFDTKLLLFSGDTEAGELFLSDSESLAILFGYSDKAFTISDTHTSSGDGPAEIIQINAKAGWNRFYMQESESNRTYKTDLRGISFDDLKWVLEDD